MSGECEIYHEHCLDCKCVKFKFNSTFHKDIIMTLHPCVKCETIVKNSINFIKEGCNNEKL